MLKKINDRFYKHFDKNANMLFTFERGEIGLYCAGSCWRLFLTYSNQKTLLACFVTHDDGHGAAKKYSFKGCIWCANDALAAANKMVAEFMED